MNPALAWLLQGDPSIRWQAMRDLDHEPAGVVAGERARIASEGWGRELLIHQDPEGTWAGGLYNPKWTSTTYTLLLLRRMGLAPDEAQARTGVSRLLEAARLIEGGVTFRRASKEGDTCVTGMVVMLGAYFAHPSPKVPELVGWLLAEQQADGGCNCEKVWGSRHGSFHTTITVLEALTEYGDGTVQTSAERGREFLLSHRLFRSHRTGEVADPQLTRLSFPPRWHYDILRGLDHFQAVGAPRDDRASDAIEVLKRKRDGDGRWPLQNHHRGAEWFRMEPPGQPSRWNTLRARRVLDWWQG